MDVTSNTVTSEGLLSGYTATKNDGTTVTGTTVGGPYYGIYDAIMQTGTVIASGNSTYKYTSEDVTNWINSYSQINNKTFQGIQFSGSFYFNNVTDITNHAFGFGYCYNGTGLASKADFYFPKLSSELYYGTFYENQVVSHISMPYCTSINSYVFYSAYLRSAIFPACVIIGRSAFQNCKYLQEANFSVCTNIGSYAFNSCTSLLSANFPSCTTIGNYAFSKCSSLITASFPMCNSVGSSAFQNCSRLMSVNFPACTTIGSGAFSGCSSLTSVNFPSCTTIGSAAFSGCINLTSTSFLACQSIAVNVFYGCSTLNEISLPLCEYIGSSAFYNCANLTTIYLPKCTYIGDKAFGYCSELVSLYITSVSSVPLLSNYMTFYYTPIGGYYGGDGHIYVPASLYNDFLVASYWSAMSSRIVSV